jgi:hypothetical protein
LVERGLQPDIARLFILDGAKALSRAVRDTFRGFALIQRCQRLFWKTCAGTAPSPRCIGRLQRFVLIKNGRSWHKHLSMSVSRGRSSKDTSLFATPRRHGRWQPLRKASKVARLNDRAAKKALHRLTFDPYFAVPTISQCRLRDDAVSSDPGDEMSRREGEIWKIIGAFVFVLSLLTALIMALRHRRGIELMGETSKGLLGEHHLEMLAVCQP